MSFRGTSDVIKVPTAPNFGRACVAQSRLRHSRRPLAQPLTQAHLPMKIMLSVLLPLVAAFGPAPAADDAGSGPAAPPPFDGGASLNDGARQCCSGQTLYVATDTWSGNPGIRLEPNAAGQMSGALAAMLAQMTNRMGMNVVYLAASDCVGGLNTGTNPFNMQLAWTCRLVTTNATVQISRFRTLWNAYQWDPDNADDAQFYSTTSFIESEMGALLHVTTTDTQGWWRFIAPFSDELWAAMIGTVVLVAFALPSVLRQKGKPLVRNGLITTPSKRVTMLYHATTELLGGGDMEWSHNISARLLKIGWLFFILISVSTYTANLAAFFTASGTTIHGPQDMTALRSATMCLPLHGNDAAQFANMEVETGVGVTIGGLVVANSVAEFDGITEEARQALYAMPPLEMLQKCTERVAAGEADGVLADRDMLTAWLLDPNNGTRCNHWTISPGVSVDHGPRVNPKQLFLAIPRAAGFTFFAHIQQSLAWLRQAAPSDVMATIYQRELRRGESCPEREESSDTDRISVGSQIGVFIVTGVCWGLALLVSGVEALMAMQREKRAKSIKEEKKAARAFEGVSERSEMDTPRSMVFTPRGEG